MSSRVHGNLSGSHEGIVCNAAACASAAFAHDTLVVKDTVCRGRSRPLAVSYFSSFPSFFSLILSHDERSVSQFPHLVLGAMVVSGAGKFAYLPKYAV